MKHVPLKSLEAQIIKPGFEEQLKPLLRYRGCQTLGRMHRMWNLMVSGLEHEATLSDITQRLSQDRNYSKLCGPENRVASMAVASFAGRLLDNPGVLAEIPHLGEYVRWVVPSYKLIRLTPMAEPPPEFIANAKGKSIIWAKEEFGHDHRLIRRWFAECGFAPTHGLLMPVPSGWQSFAQKETNIELARRYSVGTATVARWRQLTGLACLAPRKHVVPVGSIVYPFVIHDGGKPEHALLRKVNAAVPRHFDPETRADICQDLVVGILCGDFDVNDLALPTKEITKRVMKMFPTKYGPLSLDAEIPGTDGFRLLDTLTDEDSLWANL